MKHILWPLLFAATVLLSGCRTYSVTSVTNKGGRVADGGIFYALPSTTLCVDLTYRYHDLTNAIYSEYAAEMLALDNFDPEQPYYIQNVQVTYNVSADPNNYYLITPRGTSVQVDSRHLLRSVGMTPSEVSNEIGPAQSLSRAEETDAKLVLHNAAADQLQPRYNLYDRTDTFYVRGDQPGRPSLTSTRKAPRSLKQRAQAAAEEFAELEDTRADIAVSDRYTLEGKRQMLQQIEEKQAALMAQFVGKPVTETVHFFLTPAPISKNNDTLQQLVLFYFSRSEGICESDDVGALPVVCTLIPDQSLQRVRKFSRRRHTEGRNSRLSSFNRNFKYRVPSMAQISIACELFDYQADIPIAQFGPVMDLPHKHFKALFDPATGALIYYEN